MAKPSESRGPGGFNNLFQDAAAWYILIARNMYLARSDCLNKNELHSRGGGEYVCLKCDWKFKCARETIFRLLYCHAAAATYSPYATTTTRGVHLLIGEMDGMMDCESQETNIVPETIPPVLYSPGVMFCPPTPFKSVCRVEGHARELN